MPSLGREIHDVYALAETAGAVAVTPLREPPVPTALLPFIDLETKPSGELHLRGRDLFWSTLDGSETPEKWFGTGDRGTEKGRRVAGRMIESCEHRDASVHPFEREQALLDSPYVAEAFITSSNEGGMRAVILLDADQTARYAQNASVPFTHYRSLTEAAEIRALAESIVADVNRRFPEPPIASFHLLDRVFMPGDAEMGPTLTLRRYRINTDESAQTGRTR